MATKKGLKTIYLLFKRLLRAKEEVYDGHDASKERVLDAFRAMITKHVDDYASLVHEMPGLANLYFADFVALVEDSMFIVLCIKATKMFINNESYMYSEGLQLSKKWIRLLYGRSFTEKVFDFHMRLNKLALTNQEMGLLMPLLITTPSKSQKSLNK